MTVEAVLEHGVRAKVANGRLTVEGSVEFALEPVDVALSDVAVFRYERSPVYDAPGALVLTDGVGNELLLRVYPEDAHLFVEALRESSAAALLQWADSTDNE